MIGRNTVDRNIAQFTPVFTELHIADTRVLCIWSINYE